MTGEHPLKTPEATMAKPARPDTHTTTARTWQARLADGRTIQFSSAAEQLATRLTAEARTERSTIVAFAPTFPMADPSDWNDLNQAVTVKLTGSRAMVLADAQANRAAA
jgi:hypothetical protein